MIQQGLNQLLTSAAYFAQPIGEKRRDEKAFNKAQQEAEKRENEIYDALVEARKKERPVSDEQIEYAETLYVNRTKAAFARNPNKQTLENWHQAIMSREAQMEAIAEDRVRKRGRQKIRQNRRFKRLRNDIRAEEGLD